MFGFENLIIALFFLSKRNIQNVEYHQESSNFEQFDYSEGTY